MNSHRLTVLVVVAVLGIGAAFWSTQTRKPLQETPGAQPVVADLSSKLNDVTQVRFIAPGDKPIATLVRGDAGWTLQEKGGYPVDTAKVRDLLTSVSKAKRVEAKTSTPELYGKLGLADISKPDATGVQLDIDGLASPVKLIVGVSPLRGTGTYVRNAGDAQSWLTDAGIEVERDAAKWLKPEIIDVAPSRIVSAIVKPATGAVIDIVRTSGQGAAEFTLRSLPKGRALESEFIADATAGLLSGLRLDDVTPADQALPGEAVTTSTFEIEDGSTVTITSWKAGDKTLARVAVTLDETKAAAYIDTAQAREAKEASAMAAEAAASDAAKSGAADAANAATPANTAAAAAETSDTKPAAPATDPVADKATRLAALRDRVAAMQSNFGKWTYTLPPYKAGNLNKSLEEYLKPKA